mmetsp:Transcript_12241/g.23242  ORF Transcript_12241/g.23242 Transcript_12241/m.23242 type:complete len:172 (-) Transcript_12241:343-858(-)
MPAVTAYVHQPIRSLVTTCSYTSRPCRANLPRSATPGLRSSSRGQPSSARWRLHDSNPLLQGWLDITKVVSSGFENTSGNELAEKIGSEVYADINGWHLYLKDMKLQNAVAAEVSNRVSGGMQVEEAVTSTLQQIPVKLGKKTDVALLELVPNSIVGDTVKIVEDFMEDSW